MIARSDGGCVASVYVCEYVDAERNYLMAIKGPQNRIIENMAGWICAMVMAR